MTNELEKMRDIRIKQKNIRISLSRIEETNKSIREEIAPIWDDVSQNKRVRALSRELFNGRKRVRYYNKLLKEYKLGIRKANRRYDLNKNC